MSPNHATLCGLLACERMATTAIRFGPRWDQTLPLCPECRRHLALANAEQIVEAAAQRAEKKMSERR